MSVRKGQITLLARPSGSEVVQPFQRRASRPVERTEMAGNGPLSADRFRPV